MSSVHEGEEGLGAVGIFCLADEALGPWSPTPPCVDSYGSAFAKVFTLRLLSPSSGQKKDADTWFKELDVNSDGAINFEEFLILVIKVGVAAHEDIHKE